MICLLCWAVALYKPGVDSAPAIPFIPNAGRCTSLPGDSKLAWLSPAGHAEVPPAHSCPVPRWPVRSSKLDIQHFTLLCCMP